METSTASPTVERSLSALIRDGFTLLLMMVVSGLVGFLPGADMQIAGRFALAVLIKLGIAVAMVALLGVAYRPAVRVVRFYLEAALLHPPVAPPLEEAAAKVSRNLTRLIWICLVCWILVGAIEPLTGLPALAGWPLTAIRLGSLALAVAAIVGILVGARPLFGEVSAALAGQAASAPAEEAAPPVKCPGCGVLDNEGNRYCRFCGHAMTQAAEPPAASAPPLTCTRCGAAIRAPARFCPSCGKPA